MGEMNTLPGATPTFFFAPTQSEKRNQEWGSGEVAKRIGLSLQSFQRYSDQWMNISRGNGADIIESTFQKVVSGNIKPSDGLILSM